MCPSSRRSRAAGRALVGLLAASPPLAAAQGGPPLARVSLVERKVELAGRGRAWQAAVEGGPLQVGEALRTGPDSVARVELPWMALGLGPGSALSFPEAPFLAASLEGGRLLVEAEGREALKIVTPETEVRGRGRAVVRRSGRATLVTCLAGRFLVLGGESTVALDPGRGAVVSSGRPPSKPEAVPAPPTLGLWPGADPVYVAPGEPLELRWTGEAPAYQVELLPAGSDVVLWQRDLAGPPARIVVPWEGAFRWRVSARNQRGLEGVPSVDGLIAVDAR